MLAFLDLDICWLFVCFHHFARSPNLLASVVFEFKRIVLIRSNFVTGLSRARSFEVYALMIRRCNKQYMEEKKLLLPLFVYLFVVWCVSVSFLFERRKDKHGYQNPQFFFIVKVNRVNKCVIFGVNLKRIL